MQTLGLLQVLMCKHMGSTEYTQAVCGYVRDVEVASSILAIPTQQRNNSSKESGKENG